MKRKLLMLLCSLLLLTSCAQQHKPAMYMEPAKLTAQEEQIKSAAGQGRFVHMFDFQLDHQAQTVAVQVYRLEAGQWMPYTACGTMLLPNDVSKGRLTLNFHLLYEGLGFTVQDSETSYATLTMAPADLPPAPDMALYTTALSTLAEISYEQELPIALQIRTSKNEVKSISTDFFHQPQHIATEGHDEVYAVTVMFSCNPLEATDGIQIPVE